MSLFRWMIILPLAIGILSVVMAEPLEAQTKLSPLNYEPYQEEEFPSWVHNLRRGEVLFFGSLPITLFAANLGFDFFNYVESGFDSRSIPFLSQSSGTVDEQERTLRIGTALAASLLLAVGDFIIGYIHDRRTSLEED